MSLWTLLSSAAVAASLCFARLQLKFGSLMEQKIKSLKIPTQAFIQLTSLYLVFSIVG